MAVTDHNLWCTVPLFLLLVVSSAWIISALCSSSEAQTKIKQQNNQTEDRNSASVDWSAVMELFSTLNHSNPTRHDSTVECVCPPPYVRVMQQCYYANKYHKLTWEKARRFCQGMAGDLAQPRHINALIVFLLDTYGEEVSRWFIGGSDVEEEGAWRWLEGRPVDIQGWPGGEPSGGTRENCLELCFVCSRKRNFPIFPALNDENCLTELNFVCEYVMHNDTCFNQS